MTVEAQKNESLILRLDEDEIEQWNNALNEVCNGFTVANFPAAIGVSRDHALTLLERLHHASSNQMQTFSLDDLLAVRNALTTVLAELDSGEYPARMGFAVEESRRTRDALDSVAARYRFDRFHKTA
uniref:Uncharacterized protein n=2 Tax=Paracidobacterium acidisoli TaxID=2303751 RepID=A0A372ITM5_9BACT